MEDGGTAALAGFRKPRAADLEDDSGRQASADKGQLQPKRFPGASCYGNVNSGASLPVASFLFLFIPLRG